MAATPVVICDVLCFIRHRYGKLSIRELKNILVDYYGYTDLITAKEQLEKDIGELKLSIETPRVGQRYSGELKDRIIHVVDDIITLVTFMDENQQLRNLPTYTADGPDSLPSSRLYEGDLAILMKVLARMEERLGNLGCTMAAIMDDVRSLQSKQSRSSFNGLQSQTGAINHRDVQSVSTVTANAVQPTGLTARGVMFSSATTSSMERETDDTTLKTIQPHGCTTDTSAGPSGPSGLAGLQLIHEPGTQWAKVASTPVVQYNRFAVLDMTTDEEQSHSDQQFTVVQRRRTDRMRRRDQMQQQQQNTTTSSTAAGAVPAGSADQSIGRKYNKPLMFGKSSAGTLLKAARKMTKKATFCVDNIDPCYNKQDMCDFINNLSINVIQCNEVRPRRRRYEPATSDRADRKAFCITIAEDDRERFIEPENWPDSVIILNWFYKQKVEVESNIKKRRVDERDDRVQSEELRGSDGHRHHVEAAGAAAAIDGCSPLPSLSLAAASDADNGLVRMSSPVAHNDNVDINTSDVTVVYQDAESEVKDGEY